MWKPAFLIWGYRQINLKYKGSQWGSAWVCACAHWLHSNHSQEAHRVSEVLSYSAPSSFLVSCMLSPSSVTQLCTVWQRLFPQLTEWLEGELCRGTPTVSSPLSFALLLCCLLLPLCSLFATHSLPSPLTVPSRRSVSEAQMPLTLRRCCSVKSWSTLGTKHVTDTNGKSLNSFCPQTRQVGVHTKMGIISKKVRHTHIHPHTEKKQNCWICIFLNKKCLLNKILWIFLFGLVYLIKTILTFLIIVCHFSSKNEFAESSLSNVKICSFS